MLLNSEMLAKKLSVSKSWVNKNYEALPFIVLGDTGNARKQIRFDPDEIDKMFTTGFLINSSTLAQHLKVSKAWIVKNHKSIPHIILPNTDQCKRHLVRFNYNAVLESLKGGEKDYE